MSDKQWKWLAAGWFLFTTILLSIPGNALPKTNLISIPYFDKWVHVGLFAVLCWLMLRALTQPTVRKIAGFVLTVIAYGTLMEFVQLYLVANRSFDTMDILADSVGAILGTAIFLAGKGTSKK